MRMGLADDGEKVTSSERTRGRDGGRQLRAQRERTLIVVFHRRRRRRRDCRRSAEETVPNDRSGREPRTEWHTTGRRGTRLRAHYFGTSTASAAQNETRCTQPPISCPFPTYRWQLCIRKGGNIWAGTGARKPSAQPHVICIASKQSWIT